MTDHYIDPGHLAKVLGGDHSGNNVTAPGPNNIDRRNDRSMSITVDPNAPDGFVVHSHSAKNSDLECKDYVRKHLGLPDWTPPKTDTSPKPKPTVVCHYIYEDQYGEPYLRVTRKSDKSFSQSHYRIDSWETGKPSGPIIPYRLPEILARPTETIHLVEGEKSADYLASLGLLSTTAPGGGSAFPITDDFAVWFDGQSVRAYPDNDVTGRKWAERVAQRLPHAQIVWLPDQPEKAGADDWLKNGRTVDDLIAAVSVAPDAFMHESEASGDEPSTHPRISASPFPWVDPLSIPTRPRLYGEHLVRKFVSLLISPGGLGKSSLIVVEALAMASGRALLVDDLIKTPEPLTVWYWNGEDPIEETQRRVIAAAKHHGLTPEDIGNRLYTDTGRETVIMLGQIMRGEITLDETLFEALEAEITARGIDVFILDPFISSHRMGENDNGAIDAVVKRLNMLADRCNCAVEIVHHVRKPSAGSKDQTDVNDARGASALLGAVRAARVLNVMSEDIADLAKIDTNERFSYFSVSNGKSNLAKRTGESKWRHLYDFDLCNGPIHESDHVGVVEHFKAPDGLANVPADAVVKAQDVAIRHPEARYDRRSGDWFGHLVGPAINMDSMDKHGSAALAKLIDKWIGSGVLIKRMAQDQNRKMREFITVPDDAKPPQHFAYEADDDTPF